VSLLNRELTFLSFFLETVPTLDLSHRPLPSSFLHLETSSRANDISIQRPNLQSFSPLPVSAPLPSNPSFFPSLHFLLSTTRITLIMPFQSLPTEVKQLIIDEAAASDRLYQSLHKEDKEKKRARSQHPIFPPRPRPSEDSTLPVSVRRGKAVSALSLASRELRELSVKYLFKVS